MKYTQQQINEMARQFMDAMRSGSPQAYQILQRLNQKGWPAEHSMANLAVMAARY